MPVTYPLDLSGVASTNLVTNELHSVSGSKFHQQYFIVPNFAPFYVDNFHATITVNNDTRDLVEDVDFSFALQDVTGTRTTGKLMYGGLVLHNLSLNGIVSIDYQTIGGNHVADRLTVLTSLADKAYNPRTTIFNILEGVPQQFPPVPHYQDYDTFYGQEELVNALGEIRDAIVQNSSLTQEQLNEFLTIINSSALGSYVRRTGDTMTGRLTLVGAPIEPLEAATKKYVDDNTIDTSELANYMSNYHTAEYINLQLDNKVNKYGDTMTGHLTLNADPISDMHSVNKRYVDNIKDNLQTQVDSINQTLGNLGLDHVTKAYVDSAIQEVMSYVTNIVLHKK